jgi:osmotically-inducible protein OsmY
MNNFSEDNRLNFSDINVTVRDRVVILSGYAFTSEAKTVAHLDALKLSEVKKVIDEIKIIYPSKINKSIDEDIRDNILNLLGTISKKESEFIDLNVSNGVVNLKGVVTSSLKKNQIEELILENLAVSDIVFKIDVQLDK